MSGRRAGGWPVLASPWSFLLIAGTGIAAGPAPAVPPTADQSASQVIFDQGGAVDSLRLSITAPHSIRPGDTVTIVTIVENISDRPLNLYLPGRTPVTDLVVTDTTGRELWRKLEGEILPAILRTDHLVPGARLTLTDRWEPTEGPHLILPTGSYRLRAELLTESGRLSTDTVPIRVLPR